MTGDLLEHSNRRGRIMGILRGSGSAAFAVGAVIGGWLAANLSTPVVFTAASGFYAAAALVMLAVHETRRKTLPIAESVPLGAPTGYGGLGLPALFLGGVFLWTAANGATVSMWANAMKAQGYSQQMISTLWGFAALVEFPGMTVAGIISDTVGRAPVLVAGAAGAGLVYIAYSVAHWLPALIGAQLGRGLAYGGYFANAMTYTTEHASPHTRGSVSGVYSAATGSGQLAGMLAGGFIVQAFGFTPLFILCGMAAFLAAACFLALHKNERKAL